MKRSECRCPCHHYMGIVHVKACCEPEPYLFPETLLGVKMVEKLIADEEKENINEQT